MKNLPTRSRHQAQTVLQEKSTKISRYRIPTLLKKKEATLTEFTRLISKPRNYRKGKDELWEKSLRLPISSSPVLQGKWKVILPRSPELAGTMSL